MNFSNVPIVYSYSGCAMGVLACHDLLSVCLVNVKPRLLLGSVPQLCSLLAWFCTDHTLESCMNTEWDGSQIV